MQILFLSSNLHLQAYSEGDNWFLQNRVFTYLDPRRNNSSKCLIPAGNFMFKVNNRNTRTRCVTFSKLTIKTLERVLLSF